MSNLVSVKTNFTAGQVSPDLLGRGDLRIFENGARTLRNVIIHPTGGVSRRDGLQYVDEIEGAARLISFEFNTEQTYLLCFMERKLRIYKEDTCVAEIETPYTLEQLKTLNWTQSADTLLLVHPDVTPQQLGRYAEDDWRLQKWEFYSKDGKVYCPFYNFYQHKETLSPGWTTGIVDLIAEHNIFSTDWLGIRIRINGGEGEISSYLAPNHVLMTVTSALGSAVPTKDWEEQAFSQIRGFPTSVTFHQDRMVIGGSKSLPNRLWLSKSSDLFNFDLGKGLDDEAIEFAILSDQVNAIKAVVSTRHLLVFTTGAEWMVSGEPLTPGSIRLNRQTNVGFYAGNYIPPQNIDGATAFISQNGRQLREFLYTDVEQAYQAIDLTLLSNDIIKNPVDAVYHQENSVLYIVLQDGSLSCLTSYRTEEVRAWSKIVTKGKFLSLSAVSDKLYCVLHRGDKYFIEKFVPDFYVDCGIVLTSETPQKKWSGLDYLEGADVAVVADGFTLGQEKVIAGALSLEEPASRLIVGLPYEHRIEPLPYMVDGNRPFPPKAYRVIQNLFRILDTKNLTVDVGNGYLEVPLKKLYRDQILDAPSVSFSGDIDLHSLGWIRDMNKPMWSIAGEVPAAFTLLSVVNEIKIKD